MIICHKDQFQISNQLKDLTIRESLLIKTQKRLILKEEANHCQRPANKNQLEMGLPQNIMQV